MRELERLNAENLELRSLLIQAEATMQGLIASTTAAVDVMRNVSAVVGTEHPHIADAAHKIIGQWEVFLSEYKTAEATAALQNAPATNARN